MRGRMQAEGYEEQEDVLKGGGCYFGHLFMRSSMAAW